MPTVETEQLDESIKEILERAGRKGSPVEMHFHGSVTLYLEVPQGAGANILPLDSKAKSQTD